ncbi:MAG TPA: DUF1569 domain-containing protein [Terriglobales bacterium]|nr:DUF1569 domain-containing protein [Terriglobales bacterium]
MHPTVEATWKMIAEATDGMSTGQLAQHPEGKWSSAEILEHLLMTYTGTSGALRKALAKGAPTGGQPTLMDRVRQFAVVDLQFLPGGRKAPAGTVPKGLEPASVLPAIEQAIKEMDSAISECEGRFGRDVRIANHPVLGPLRAEQWRRFHMAHCRHHMKQVAALRGGLVQAVGA